MVVKTTARLKEYIWTAGNMNSVYYNYWRILFLGYNGVSYFLSCWYVAQLIRPRRWRRYVPPKRRLTFNKLHGVSLLLLCWYLARLIRPWRCGWQVPPKHRLTFNGLHGPISQQIVTAAVREPQIPRDNHCFHVRAFLFSQCRDKLICILLYVT
jgi:hypothetical protein